jgi:dihydroorotate dehydrogenase electron transfer subunit
MGARTRSLLAGIDDFRKLPLDAKVSTDDGSAGFHGLVTDLLASLLEKESNPGRVRVYGCGPQGMNESLRRFLVERRIPGEICLESLMACGFGICFVCVAPIRKEPDGEFFMRRICREGPVFDARLLHPGIVG